MTASILISLVAHAIAAKNMVCHTDEKAIKLGLFHPPQGMLVSLVQAKPPPAIKTSSSISMPFDNAAAKPVIPANAAMPPEEMPEESPYSSPGSIEQMASVMDLADLPPPPVNSFNHEGFMRIKVFVNEEGLADYVELLESNFAEDYATTLVELFKSAKFRPGVSGGKAIKSWRIVEIDYSSS
ncbi:MAG: hypothetical protein CVU31_02175 [Betaproteobacteria bacterium HGW-Betaproteobacteria-4]|nr:MAG: hypothetical protein CVU31_02175 [Betaproteobacteria bacterium HGW-Betaproteobacteria-4]